MGRKVIWRFPIDAPRFTFRMPKGSEIVKVDLKGDAPAFWALLDPNVPTEEREFSVFWTGETIPEGWIYRGTWQTEKEGHIMVFHLFEIPAGTPQGGV